MDNFSQEEEKEINPDLDLIDAPDETVGQDVAVADSDSVDQDDIVFEEESDIKTQIQGEVQSNNSGDIQFEEVLDIDKLQDALNKQMNPESEPKQSSSEEVLVPKEEEDVLPPAPVEQITDFPITPNSKKYVIYIEPYNIDFMESLSLSERKSIINKILKEQNELSLETKKIQQKKSFLVNLGVALATFIIGFPIVFWGVNKSMQISISNYSVAKQQFEKLYRPQGKIKPSDNYLPNVINP